MQIKTSIIALLEKLINSSLKSSLVKGAGGSLGLKVFYTLLSFITSIVLSRILGARGFGHYTYAISSATLASFPAMMGLNVLLTREAARFKALDAWRELCGLLKWTDRTVLLTLKIVCGVKPISDIFSPDAVYCFIPHTIWLN